jgi:hypothetical protein
VRNTDTSALLHMLMDYLERAVQARPAAIGNGRQML